MTMSSSHLSFILEALERCEDDIVIIGSTRHLGGEQCHHLGEVHGSIHFVQHGLSLSSSNVFAIGSKGRDQVRGRQETVLVCVHDSESGWTPAWPEPLLLQCFCHRQ